MIFVVSTASTISSYISQTKTNRAYLKELIEGGAVQKTATGIVSKERKASTAPTLSDAEWMQIEKGLSECLVKEANKFLASGDPYLIGKADKSTPITLAKLFLDACGAMGSGLPADFRGAPLPDTPKGMTSSNPSKETPFENSYGGTLVPETPKASPTSFSTSGWLDFLKSPTTLIMNQKNCTFGGSTGGEVVNGRFIVNSIIIMSMEKLDGNRIVATMRDGNSLVLDVNKSTGSVTAALVVPNAPIFLECSL